MSTVQEILALNKARQQIYKGKAKEIKGDNQAVTDAAFADAAKYGYTPTPETEAAATTEIPANDEKEAIDAIHGAGSYDSAMKPDESTPYLENFYKSTVKAPTPISEKGMANARLASGIGEGLQSLGEILGASRGARVSNRDFSNSPIAQQGRNEKEIRNIYDQKESAYNNGLLNAKIGDYGQELQTKANNRSFIRKSIQDSRAAKIQAEKERRDFEYKMIDLGFKEADRKLKLKQFDEDQRKNKADEGIKRQAVTEKQNRTNADMEIVTRVRSLPVEWQKKMGFLKPVATETVAGKKTEWTFDNSIKPEVLEAAVKEYEKNPIMKEAPTQQNFNIVPIGNQQSSQTGNVR